MTQDEELRQRHTCHLMGAHTMLVVGGIKPGFNDIQPFDAKGRSSPRDYYLFEVPEEI